MILDTIVIVNDKKIHINELTINSPVKINVQCDRCSNVSITSVKYYFTNFNNTGEYTCKKCNYEDRIKKRIETITTIDENGNSISKKNAEKAKQTILKNGGYSKQSKKMAKTRNKKLANGLTSYQQAARSKTFQSNRRKTMEELNRWVPKEYVKDFQLYRREVKKITQRQNLTSLNGYKKRSREYHLDHKFSIFEGFKRNILPYIISDISNLRIITREENVIKGYSCSVTEEELFQAFYDFHNFSCMNN